ncbi:transcription termination factor MTERF5, chloroplastic-like [Benincasa hispida]|uniref:transcription termination factor MTERF5, chloroplastic-like n=1 Tax=Benincasa hispida TaxID=102211 RepID=UPI0019025E74|nr:transcription termination factor MTERF5, chloroplastic-like [Benincasa hispida]
MYALRPSFSVSSRLNPPSFLRIHPFLYYFFSSSSSSSHTQSSASNAIVVQYLIDTFQLSPARAASIMSCRRGLQSTEKPQSVYKYLSDLGFSDAHIRSAIRLAPQIAFSNIEKTLKPKIEFFQNLGLVGSDLSKFISRHSTLLTVSLEKKLMPSVEILKNILPKDNCNDDLLLVIRRWSDRLMRTPCKRLSININYLQSCGIVDSQLLMLLKRQSSLFGRSESRLKDIVSVVVEIGFSTNTRMFVHGLHAISSVSKVTLKKKVELICSFGITEKECMRMFTSAPVLIRTSIGKLKLGLEFFMNEAKVSKSDIVGSPACLMHAMQGRVLPRYRVLQIVKSKRLMKKHPKFILTLGMSDEDFLDRFVCRFPDNMKDLLVAYRGNSVSAK